MAIKLGRTFRLLEGVALASRSLPSKSARRVGHRFPSEKNNMTEQRQQQVFMQLHVSISICAGVLVLVMIEVLALISSRMQ